MSEKEKIEQALTPKKWLVIDDARMDLVSVAKTAELATNSIIDDGDYYAALAVIEVLLKAIRQSCDILKGSIEEWQNECSYLAEGDNDVTDVS